MRTLALEGLDGLATGEQAKLAHPAWVNQVLQQVAASFFFFFNLLLLLFLVLLLIYIF
jgi:hypothetical protein